MKFNASNTRSVLLEAKADQEAFIDKFGQETFDKFKLLKDGLKNRNISIDIIYHVKNTSPEEMEEIIYNVDKHIENKSDEENKIKVAENESFVVYEILDHKTAMKYGKDTVWCISGRYSSDHKIDELLNLHPKESQAKQYFYHYIDKYYTCFLFVISKKGGNSFCICPRKRAPHTADIWDRLDSRVEYSPARKMEDSTWSDFIKSCPKFTHKGFTFAWEDFLIDESDNSLVTYQGSDAHIVLPDNIDRIQDDAFTEANIESIEIKNIKAIGKRAFKNCSKLKSINIESGLKVIRESTFEGCANLIECNLPSTVDDIELNAFAQCNYNLKINMVKHKIRVREVDAKYLKTHINWIQNESLNEAFSTTMPTWLKNAILDQESYSTSRSYSHTLLQYLNKNNIDINKANFIVGDVPTNVRDPRLKSPYIPFFHVLTKGDNNKEYHQVYAKGINDRSAFYIGGNSLNSRQFKDHSLKTILQYTVDFCYIDSTDSNNYNSDVKSSRSKMNKELDNINYYRQKARTWRWDIDKSGYIIDPDKYKRKLDNLHKNNHQEILEKMYNRIIAAKQTISDITNNLDISELDHSDFMELYNKNVHTYFVEAVRMYNNFAEALQNALAKDPEQRESDLDKLFRVDTNNYDYLGTDIRKVENCIANLESAINKCRTVALESLHISQPDSKIWKKIKASIKYAGSDLDSQADNVMDNLHAMQDRRFDEDFSDEEDLEDDDIVLIYKKDQIEEMSRDEAIDHYREEYRTSEGSNQLRYLKMLIDLIEGKTEIFDEDR